MKIFTAVLLLLLGYPDKSTQSCSSTVAITTCPWTDLRSSKPLRIDDYKTYLSFTKGNLERVPSGSFRQVPQVSVLQLSHNKIKDLEEGSFEGLDNLVFLNLYDNQLKSVGANVLKHCGKLEKLDLGMNRIATVDEKAFGKLDKLRELNLGFNALKVVPTAVKSLANLRVLKLDNNAISVLKSGAFSTLSVLEELTVADNKLTNIENGAFAGLRRLTKLDLRSNFLTDLNVANVLADAGLLRQVGLSINNFNCHVLQKVVEELKKKNVEVNRGVSKSPDNIIGIACKK